MNKRIFILLLGMTSLLCNGQSFLSRYPRLTIENLSNFFLDWKAYSDSINTNNIITDSIAANILGQEYVDFWCKNDSNNDESTPKFCVFPQTIRIERYLMDVDTAMAKLTFGFTRYIPGMSENQFAIDSVTPILPPCGLYLTADIDKMLSTFAGGIKTDNRISEINKNNRNELEKYIPVNYGHWGGYWWFTSFPLITDICYANNLIAVMRRTSWWTGDTIWYVKEHGKFIRQSKPATSWVE